MFLKTYNNEFDEITKMVDRLTLLINKSKCYYTEPRKRKYVTGYGKMFKEYDLNVQQQKTTCLQSGLSFENLGIEDNDDVNDDKLAQTTNEIITLAAEKSP